MGRQDNIKFRITSLRQDKIIYAVEACALSLVCLVFFFFSTQYFHGDMRTVVNRLALIVAATYTFYMGCGNTKRLREIRRLEKQLDD